MDTQAPELSELDVNQLEQVRDRLQGNLEDISQKINANPPSDIPDDLTFMLARRNFIQGTLERVEKQLLFAKVSKSTTEDIVGIGNVAYIQRGNDIRAIMLIPAAHDVDDEVEYVSVNSSLGKALVGKREKDTVVLKTSLGKQNYGILRIV